MLKGKLKIKEAVDYFDANYVLEQLPVVRFGFSKPNYYSLYVYYYDDVGGSCSKFIYSSYSFEACKRHLKFAYFDFCSDHSVSISSVCFCIYSYRKGVSDDTLIACTTFVVNFKFERHESLCNV